MNTERQFRVAFTGGSGKAGKYSVKYLMEKGHKVLNIDLVPSSEVGVDNLIADITDSGQVFNSLTSYINRSELDLKGGHHAFDALVHFAAIPRILVTPDNECFRVNTIGTYNAIEAAVKLGIKKIIIASSETAYGICFAHGELHPKYLPIDEKHPTEPMDSYGLSKVVNEETAKAFSRRSGLDIYVLRIGNVIEPHEYHLFNNFFKNPIQRRRNIFCYIDARDLGQIVELCLKKDGLGFEIFNAGNDTNSVNISSRSLAKKFFPGVPFIREIEEHEALFSNQKICQVLGFVEEHNWRKYVVF